MVLRELLWNTELLGQSWLRLLTVQGLLTGFRKIIAVRSLPGSMNTLHPPLLWVKERR